MKHFVDSVSYFLMGGSMAQKWVIYISLASKCTKIYIKLNRRFIDLKVYQLNCY